MTATTTAATTTTTPFSSRGAGGSNPLKDDPTLKKLLHDISSIPTELEFTRWKSTFLEAFATYLHPTATQNANAAFTNFSQHVMELAKMVRKLEVLRESGDMTLEKCSVQARRALGNFAQCIGHVTTLMDQLTPGTLEQEQAAGFTKFHLGAVLVRDGFVEYDRLAKIQLHLQNLRDENTNGLDQVADQLTLQSIDKYGRTLDKLLDILADLGLYQAMEKCTSFIKGEWVPMSPGSLRKSRTSLSSLNNDDDGAALAAMVVATAPDLEEDEDDEESPPPSLVKQKAALPPASPSPKPKAKPVRPESPASPPSHNELSPDSSPEVAPRARRAPPARSQSVGRSRAFTTSRNLDPNVQRGMARSNSNTFEFTLTTPGVTEWRGFSSDPAATAEQTAEHTRKKKLALQRSQSVGRLRAAEEEEKESDFILPHKDNKTMGKNDEWKGFTNSEKPNATATPTTSLKNNNSVSKKKQQQQQPMMRSKSVGRAIQRDPLLSSSAPSKKLTMAPVKTNNTNKASGAAAPPQRSNTPAKARKQQPSVANDEEEEDDEAVVAAAVAATTGVPAAFPLSRKRSITPAKAAPRSSTPGRPRSNTPGKPRSNNDPPSSMRNSLTRSNTPGKERSGNSKNDPPASPKKSRSNTPAKPRNYNNSNDPTVSASTSAAPHSPGGSTSTENSPNAPNRNANQNGIYTGSNSRRNEGPRKMELIGEDPKSPQPELHQPTMKLTGQEKEKDGELGTLQQQPKKKKGDSVGKSPIEDDGGSPSKTKNKPHVDPIMPNLIKGARPNPELNTSNHSRVSLAMSAQQDPPLEEAPSSPSKRSWFGGRKKEDPPTADASASPSKRSWFGKKDTPEQKPPQASTNSSPKKQQPHSQLQPQSNDFNPREARNNKKKQDPLGHSSTHSTRSRDSIRSKDSASTAASRRSGRKEDSVTTQPKSPSKNSAPNRGRGVSRTLSDEEKPAPRSKSVRRTKSSDDLPKQRSDGLAPKTNTPFRKRNEEQPSPVQDKGGRGRSQSRPSAPQRRSQTPSAPRRQPNEPSAPDRKARSQTPSAPQRRSNDPPAASTNAPPPDDNPQSKAKARTQTPSASQRGRPEETHLPSKNSPSSDSNNPRPSSSSSQKQQPRDKTPAQAKEEPQEPYSRPPELDGLDACPCCRRAF